MILVFYNWHNIRGSILFLPVWYKF